MSIRLLESRVSIKGVFDVRSQIKFSICQVQSWHWWKFFEEVTRDAMGIRSGVAGALAASLPADQSAPSHSLQSAPPFKHSLSFRDSLVASSSSFPDPSESSSMRNTPHPLQKVLHPIHRLSHRGFAIRHHQHCQRQVSLTRRSHIPDLRTSRACKQTRWYFHNGTCKREQKNRFSLVANVDQRLGGKLKGEAAKSTNPLLSPSTPLAR